MVKNDKDVLEGLMKLFFKKEKYILSIVDNKIMRYVCKTLNVRRICRRLGNRENDRDCLIMAEAYNKSLNMLCELYPEGDSLLKEIKIYFSINLFLNILNTDLPEMKVIMNKNSMILELSNTRYYLGSMDGKCICYEYDKNGIVSNIIE